MPEAQVKAGVRKILDEEKVWYFMPTGAGYGRAGIPDIVACVNGHFLAIECKAGKGKTTALQEREIQRIQDAGGLVVVPNESSIAQVRVAVQALKLRSRI